MNSERRVSKLPQLRIIMGLKGTGKTKHFIELVNHALKEEKGDIVCIERGSRLTYDLPHEVRLVESSDYEFNSYEYLKGFISGLHSGNYDITHIFIDSVLKMIGKSYDEQADDFFDWIEAFGAKHGIRFTLMVSSEAAKASERIKHYLD